MQLITFFHLNLAFSSIPEEQRGNVIARCYWPLLNIVERHKVPFGIEASAYTLQVIHDIDPGWVTKLRQLCDSGLCEFVGAGYAQVIGPLAPASVNHHNLRLGQQSYETILGKKPRVALVNEQAYAAGLVPHYLDAGYEAIIMEWDNAARAHPEWDRRWRRYPQYALGPDGGKIPVLWNKSIAFQKFQRYAHGEMNIDEYLGYLDAQSTDISGVFPLYGNDAECFDFRPGRFMTEAPLADEGEWARIDALIGHLKKSDRYQFISPSDALTFLTNPLGGNELSLQSASQPIPVKKQDKYNPIRWGVSGRDDLEINTSCWRLYEALSASPSTTDDDWRELCYLWSSDFRTHITEPRWHAYRTRLNEALGKWKVAHKELPVQVSSTAESRPEVTQDKRAIRIRGRRLDVALNLRKGLVIDHFIDHSVSDEKLFGTIEHGYFDDISLGADFYTGHLVFEAPGKPKATDLAPCEPSVNWEGSILTIAASLPSSIGPIEKIWRIDDAAGTLELQLQLNVPAPAQGSLRLGHVTLNPEAFDADSLCFRTNNGGSLAETFSLSDQPVQHGRPVSFLVSANQALGMTEGWIELGDARHCVRIDVDKGAAALLGLVTFQTAAPDYFFRLALTAKELDDTAKPAEAQHISARMTLSAKSSK
jgi:hypothetical protein